MSLKIPISIVVATYNRSWSLRRLLESLRHQDLPAEAWECVVVDNNSADDTTAVAQGFAARNEGLNVTVVFEGRQGLSYARNSGIERSSGEVVVIVDDDEVLGPQFLSSYKALFEDEAVMCGGGRIVPEYDGGRPGWMSSFCESAIASPIDLGRSICEFGGRAIPGGGNMAFRRSALERYGLFDVTLGRSGGALFGGEESNLFARFRGGAERVWYCPGAVTHHFIPDSRLQRSYLSRLWHGVGMSQMVRARLEHGTGWGMGSGSVRAIAAECLKWCAVVLLMAWYGVTLRPSKGWYILFMRWRITRGILSAI